MFLFTMNACIVFIILTITPVYIASDKTLVLCI